MLHIGSCPRVASLGSFPSDTRHKGLCLKSEHEVVVAGGGGGGGVVRGLVRVMCFYWLAP